jgi:hypothetical protein
MLQAPHVAVGGRRLSRDGTRDSLAAPLLPRVGGNMSALSLNRRWESCVASIVFLYATVISCPKLLVSLRCGLYWT